MRSRIHVAVFAVLARASAACGGGGQASGPGANGSLNVQLSTGALEAGQTLSYRVTLSAEDAADPSLFVVALDTIVMPTESDGSFTGVLPCHGSDAGLIGKADVVATLSDANGGVVGTGDATTLFDCKAGTDTPVSLDVSVVEGGSEGFADVAVSVAAVPISCKTDIADSNGKTVVTTGYARGRGTSRPLVAQGGTVNLAFDVTRAADWATSQSVDKGAELDSAPGGGSEYFNVRWTVDTMAPTVELMFDGFEVQMGLMPSSTNGAPVSEMFVSKPIVVHHEADIAIDEPGVQRTRTSVGHAAAALTMLDEHGIIIQGGIWNGYGTTPDGAAAYGIGAVTAPTTAKALVGPAEVHGVVGPNAVGGADSRVWAGTTKMYFARGADGTPLSIAGKGGRSYTGGRFALDLEIVSPDHQPPPPVLSAATKYKLFTVTGEPTPVGEGKDDRHVYVAVCTLDGGTLACDEDAPGSGYLHLYSPRDAASGLATGR